MDTGTWVYARGDGVTLDLNDGVSIKLRHHDGLGMGDFQHATADVPGLHGDYWMGTRFPARTITLELMLHAANLAALQNLRRDILSKLNPIRYSGTLKITQLNGDVRWFDCVLAESLPMPTQQHIARREMPLIVRFRSTGDPFLYDPTEQVYNVPNGVFANTFMAPNMQFPFILTASEAFADATINYVGHVPTPVRLIMTGPGNSPVFQSDTLERVLDAPLVFLTAGQTFEINTDPRARNVLLNGANGWAYLGQSGFWWLEPGNNDVHFEANATTVATAIQMRYYNRYLGI